MHRQVPEGRLAEFFPEKIKGKYARFDRPVAGGIANIWISYSDDLVTWGNSRCVMTIRDDHWDSWRIGASSQPIKIEDETGLEIWGVVTTVLHQV